MPLSRTSGLCQGCAEIRMTANIIDLQTHTGYHFTRWRQRVAASVGGTLLDEQRG